MPNPKGAILTERDRVLLSYVGIARYASADQIHPLFFAEVSKKQTYRRLAKLCKPGPRLGEGACLRQMQYRRAEGTAVPVWALTAFGRSVVAPLVPYLRPPAAHDIGHRFLEHTLLLNDVLVGLVLALRASRAAPLACLPFRWLSEDDGVLEFETTHRETGTIAKAVLKPDAIVEIPSQERRVFIEAETGTQSIVTAHPDRTGAVVSKLQRYWEFFGSTGGHNTTWYERAFPRDKLFARLVFIVHSSHRAARVEQAIKKHLGSLSTRAFDVRVPTFENAAWMLADFIRPGATVPTPLPVRGSTNSPRTVTGSRQAGTSSERAGGSPEEDVLALDHAQLVQLRQSFKAVGITLEEAFAVVAKHEAHGSCRLGLPPLPRDHLAFLQQLILWGKFRPPSQLTTSQGGR